MTVREPAANIFVSTATEAAKGAPVRDQSDGIAGLRCPDSSRFHTRERQTLMFPRLVTALACSGAILGTLIVHSARADEKVDRLKTKKLTTIAAQADDLKQIRLSPDGKTLATITGLFGKSVDLWDAATGESNGVLSGPDEPVNSVVFTGDGKTVITGDRG